MNSTLDVEKIRKCEEHKQYEKAWWKLPVAFLQIAAKLPNREPEALKIRILILAETPSGTTRQTTARGAIQIDIGIPKKSWKEDEGDLPKPEVAHGSQ